MIEGVRNTPSPTPGGLKALLVIAALAVVGGVAYWKLHSAPRSAVTTRLQSPSEALDQTPSDEPQASESKSVDPSERLKDPVLRKEDEVNQSLAQGQEAALLMSEKLINEKEPHSKISALPGLLKNFGNPLVTRAFQKLLEDSEFSVRKETLNVLASKPSPISRSLLTAYSKKVDISLEEKIEAHAALLAVTQSGQDRELAHRFITQTCLDATFEDALRARALQVLIQFFSQLRSTQGTAQLLASIPNGPVFTQQIANRYLSELSLKKP